MDLELNQESVDEDAGRHSQTLWISMVDGLAKDNNMNQMI